ncbi:unnamed protein product [Enterobius vermicularis]|uniref:Tr-type G domain-containing protein n=1 Tax=Enterobius vermicularis TaxID=51028 RepID=A0A0N4V7C8_ENTVE|nr:unnamed protein product [Enterobius vermicularis]
MLYLAGATKAVGDVDSGNTVTDFLELERERGITIQSAAIFFDWMNCKINLIDTPGHVDFSLEVERCARVLDAAVTVLDASAGVEAQTIAVWEQAKKFQLPCAFFLNKMDKPNADYQKSIESISERLLMKNVVPVSLPYHMLWNLSLCEYFCLLLEIFSFTLPTATYITLPAFGKDGKFCGIYDLLEKKYLNCLDGNGARWTEILAECEE